MNVTGIFNALESHLRSLGVFETVNIHEPKKAPGDGVHAALWVQSADPVPGLGGLNRTSMRLEFWTRIYKNMLSEPQDSIDTEMLEATDKVMTAYSGDFTLGGTVKMVDLLGAHGRGLSFQAGYLDQDGKKYRAYVIRLPLIVDDVWSQTP